MKRPISRAKPIAWAVMNLSDTQAQLFVDQIAMLAAEYAFNARDHYPRLGGHE
jgi:hypothetical protein